MPQRRGKSPSRPVVHIKHTNVRNERPQTLAEYREKQREVKIAAKPKQLDSLGSDRLVTGAKDKRPKPPEVPPKEAKNDDGDGDVPAKNSNIVGAPFGSEGCNCFNAEERGAQRHDALAFKNRLVDMHGNYDGGLHVFLHGYWPKVLSCQSLLRAPC